MNRGSEKNLKFNKLGGQNKRGSEFVKRLRMTIKRQKHVIKQEIRIHTEAGYFALKLDLKSTSKERNIIEIAKKLHFRQN